MSTDLATVEQERALATGAGAQLPAFMQQDKGEGKEGLKEYFVPPRAKLVQSQSNNDLKKQHKVATVVAMPAGIVIAAPTSDTEGTPFHFTPVLRFTEFVTFNPLGADVFVRERDLNPMGEIARKSRDQKVRNEQCPEKINKNEAQNIMKHREVINYLCVVHDVDDLYMMPILFSFHSGGFKDGKQLATLLTLRQGDPPIYANVFAACVGPRRSNDNDYLGIGISNPKGIPYFVQDNDQYLALQRMHRQFKELLGAGEIRPDYDTDLPGEGQVYETTARTLDPGLDPAEGERF